MPIVTTSGPRCRTLRTTVEPSSRLGWPRPCGASGSSAGISPRVEPRSRASSLCRPRLLGHPLGRSALAGLGGLRYWQGDLAAAGEAYAEALEIERDLDDPRGLAEALYDAGFVAAITGDHATARTDYEESLEIYRELGDAAAVGRLSEALVFLMFHDGEFAAARVIQEENVRVFRASGEAFRIANGLNLLSAIQLKAGDLDAARASQAEAIGIFHAATDVPGVIRALLLARRSSLSPTRTPTLRPNERPVCAVPSISSRNRSARSRRR